MDLLKPLIINTEVFFQCHGHCEGCFLNDKEKNDKKTYFSTIKMPLLKLLKKANNISHIILGFGRGNLLNMSNNNLDKLLNLIEECEKIIPKEKITYEVSSSLIGKINTQIEKALYLLNRNKNIYFNVVVNSEIISNNFWNNLKKFYDTNSKLRQSWGMIDNYSDILVLNINPKILPDLNFIEKYVENHNSPINISLFPFTDKTITNEDLLALNNWSEELWIKFSHKDLNIKNFLKALNQIDVGNELNDIINYHNNNKNAYYFIDKNGEIISGSLSIMGEIDYVRLLKKYSIDPDPQKALALMQKTKPCNICEYQKECVLTGAYLNMMNNLYKIQNAKHCLSGYAPIFELASKPSQISS